MRIAPILATFLALAACAGGGAAHDVASDPGAGPDADEGSAADGNPGPDDLAEAEAAPEPLPVFGPIVLPPATSLVPSTLESCPVYRRTSCAKGALRRCDLWDATAGAWAEHPDPWADQVFWYDRYFDLYHLMEGQQAEFLYTRKMAPGTPESEWGAPESFERYEGFWDSAGWTGTALQAAAARYAVTGTPADHDRMVDRMDAMMLQYEATGVPGLLMRCHYAMLEEGAPPPVGHPGKALVAHTPPANWEDHNTIAPAYLARLPAYYRDGVEIGGKHYGVEAKWMGHASRDMYVRSLPGILLAYDLLGAGDREDRLREAVRRLVPCTLNRLKKLRIRSIQSNQDVRDAIAAYLGTGTLQLEPGDLDLAALDTVYGYVMEEPKPEAPGAFDPTCPDGPPMDVDPAYDLDATADDFALTFVNMLLRANGQSDVPIAWMLVPSARGTDALFMAQWALAGHYLTGDGRYLDWLARLIDEVAFWPVIDTMGSFRLPKWCRSHYGPSLAYPTFWNLQSRIDRATRPQFWHRLARAVKEEFRFKELVDANDAYFGVLYDGTVDDDADPDRSEWVGQMVDLLRETSQYPATDPFEPRRSYDTDFLSNPPPGVAFETEPLTPDQRAICEQPIEVFGVKLQAETIQDDRPRAKVGLPIRYRIGGPFQWQEDPYQMARSYGDRDGRTQWPMSCFSVAYWTGRMQGTFKDGEGLALAWRDTGQGCGQGGP
jgi:hypothetical protein